MSCKPSRNICPVGATSEGAGRTAAARVKTLSSSGPPWDPHQHGVGGDLVVIGSLAWLSNDTGTGVFGHRPVLAAATDTEDSATQAPAARPADRAAVPTGDRGPCVRRDGGAQNRLAASTGGPDTSSGAPWSPKPTVSTASGYLVCKLQPSPDPMSCMEVGAQHVGLAAKAVGCVVLVRRAVMGCLRLALALELSNDRVDVWHCQLAPGRLG